VFDPAVYRGDREVDLAMARLFGGFPAAFFEGYEQEWPLPAGHRQRVELYNLYHLLNHANLFGGGYWQQSAASIRALLRTWS
jgi:fructosamine-3-kinase